MHDQADQANLITIGQARDMLGVSRTTMARLVKEGRFTLYLNPLDRRQKLVDIAEVRRLATPVLIPAGTSDQYAGDFAPQSASSSAAMPERDAETPPATVTAFPAPMAPRREPDEARAMRLLLTLVEAEQAVGESAFVLTSHGEIIHDGLPGGRMSADLKDVEQLLSEGYVRVLPGVRRRLDSGAVGREFVLTNAVLETMRHLGGT
jgi:hypothetical protein